MSARSWLRTRSTTSLDGLVVAITGGARGIGLATATMLHNLGAKVAIESFAAFPDMVEDQLGPLDVLINNAGIMPTGLLVDEPEHVTRRILDINALGVITGSKLAAQRPEIILLHGFADSADTWRLVLADLLDQRGVADETVLATRSALLCPYARPTAAMCRSAGSSPRPYRRPTPACFAPSAE